VADDTDWLDLNAAANVIQGAQGTSFSGLTANTAYSFVIYPYTTGGTTDPDFKTDGSVPTASTSTPVPPGLEPTAHVTNFTANATSSSSINLTWTDAAGAAKYLVLAKTGAGTFTAVVDGTAVASESDWANNNAATNVNQGAGGVSFTGLAGSTSYSFTIYPYSEGGTPSPNYKTDGTVPTAAATTPAAPVAFDPSLLTITSITVSGSPYDVTTDANNYKAHPQPSDVFIYSPRIILAPRPAGDYVIAWEDKTAKIIKLTFMNSNDTKNGGETDLVTGAEGLAGFALNGTGYVVGFTSGSSKEKVTVRGYSSSFSQSFSTDLTGTVNPLTTVGAKQSPMKFGSSRIAVDETGGKIGIFLAHEMVWPGPATHQGGLFRFMDTGGALQGTTAANGEDGVGGSNWIYSHCLDNRLIVKNSKWAIVSNGDATPRAIPFRTVQNNVKTDNSSVFAIDGSTGDNDTKTQLGGLIARDDGTYMLTFSTAVGRPTRDVCFIRLSSIGSVQTQKFLTTYSSTATGYAINVKTAAYGTNILVAWEETSTNAPSVFKAMFCVVDADGTFVFSPVQFPNARFNRGDDFASFGNGDVGWVTGSGSSLKVHRVKVN
jgi:hypothetical protein